MDVKGHRAPIRSNGRAEHLVVDPRDGGDRVRRQRQHRRGRPRACRHRGRALRVVQRILQHASAGVGCGDSQKEKKRFRHEARRKDGTRLAAPVPQPVGEEAVE